MKIEIPKNDTQKENELKLKKACLDMAVKICLAKSYSNGISTENIIKEAERLRKYLEDREEK
jgi:hypothetical protein